MSTKHLLFPVLAALATLAGCAEERPPINRVQPFALEKSFFVGDDLTDPRDDPEFWTQATLIDVGYGASQDGLFTSTYAQPMSRIKWQVTEDMLIGRIAYERIEGTDGKGVGGPVNDGIVAVAFRIESHFDIINSYNPTTGEKLNIIDENASDRPWYERTYFRVDFSQNLSTDNYDFDTLSMVGIFGGVTYEAMKYDVTDPADPHAPVFDVGTGYFDITSKAFAKPQVIDLSHLGWGIDAFPACFLDPDFMGGTGPSAQCSPVELTIRHSFRRVEDTDFEPQDWDGFRFQAYGAFTAERNGYARNYGMSDDLWHRFIARYDIWARSHYYANPEEMTGFVACYTPETTPFGADPHRDEDGDGTEDECAAVGNGSRCDTFRQRCTLPFMQRTPNPVIWHYTNESDLEYFDASRLSTHDWDVALRLAVNSAKYAECTRLGGSKESCVEQFPVHFGQQDENEDTVRLALEVKDCQEGRAYAGQDCMALADTLGAQRGYSAAVIELAKMSPMVVLCHSPVAANDPAECGDKRLPEGIDPADCRDAWTDPEGELAKACADAGTVRMGDLRYHQVNVMSNPQTPSPWGIMTDAVDPLTGQTVSASVNVWAHVNDLFSQKVIDQIRYLKGELTSADITEGDHIRRWAQAAQAATTGGMTPKFSKAQVADAAKSFAYQEAAAKEGANAWAKAADVDVSEVALPPDVIRQARQLKKQLQNVRSKLDSTSVMKPIYAARARAAAGTDVEAQLITPMFQELMGIEGMPTSEGVLNRISPLRGGNRSFERDLYNMREIALAERGSCMLAEAPAPISMTGMADVLERKFGPFNPNDDRATQFARAEKMRRYIARKAHYAVMVHEMGHSIGLRHNFVSSSDAYNYRPQYWQLRTNNGAVTEPCTDLAQGGEDCVGPRYFDPVTDSERDNLIWMWMHSSVMDYAGEITQDMLGLGAYDFAAAKMFYGETVAVFGDESYAANSNRGSGMLGKMDNFGGILGFQWNIGGQDDSFHYSELNNNYELIQDCKTVNPDDFKPGDWDDSIYGTWDPLLDGHMVFVDGNYTRCKQQPVDYARWTDLKMPAEGQAGGFYRGGVAIDGQDRVRVPYGFGTDSWADLGNLSVYRHDNGADPYELFDFFVSNQEINHIFDNYRRNRQTFSIRGAVGRTLGRYNEKMRDAAKGLGLLKNIYKDFSLSLNYDFNEFWPVIAPLFFKENILASGLAFDHFTRQLARPEHGDHFRATGDPVLRSARDQTGDTGEALVTIPNGATGFIEQVGIGGRPVENQLSDTNGEYDSQYTINAGSYYEKMYTAMLMSESVDNFISSSRTDFTDPRYRSVSLADLFPDGFRRWLGNNLTGDDELKGMRLSAGFGGLPRVDDDGFPSAPMGHISWWGSTPRVCFPDRLSQICGTFGNEADPSFAELGIQDTVVLDPQVQWEQQKFLIAMTLMYLPENQKTYWVDMMQLWELGVDSDPGFENRIELHLPTGRVYVAKTYGKETIFGKRVQRGIAARMLEYANELLAAAYEVEPGPDLDGDDAPDWWIPVIGDSGQPLVQYDPTIQHITPLGTIAANGVLGCNRQGNWNCTCESNRACGKLADYQSLPSFLRQAMGAFGMGLPSPRGIY